MLSHRKKVENMDGKILIVDDDSSIRLLVSDVLSDQGLTVVTAASGEEAVTRLEGEDFDLILLDIMMKGMDGLEVCRRVRDRVDCPILFLSAKDSSRDIIAGLGLGADDYLTKPFELEVLSARIQAHLRRQSRAVPSAANIRGPIRIGEITLDAENMTATRSGEVIPLSTRELELLHYLMSHAGQTLSRERIYRDVWKSEYGDISTVAINIKNLRLKIDPQWQYIKTVWGQGYRFVTQSGLAEEDSHGS